MRIRSIKPEFWSHRMHRKISEPAALLALGLLNFADDEGRFEADAAHLAATLFPRRPLSRPVEDCLEELEVRTEFLVRYEALVDGEPLALAQIINFHRHQVINKFKSSRLPPPPKGTLPEDSRSATVALPDPSEPHDGSPPGSEESSKNGALPPLQEGKGRERKEGKGPARALEADFPEAEIPSLAQVLTECSLRAIPEQTGRDFWQHYENVRLPAWTDGAGQRFKWRGKLGDWQVKNRERGGTGKKPASTSDVSELARLDAALEHEQDSTKRKALRAQKEKLTVNA